MAKRSSELERRARRRSGRPVKLKKVEYMEQHIGEAFDGVISGVTAYGLYVELNNTVEGLVHVNSLTDDFTSMMRPGSELRGARTGKVWRIGERVRIRVKGTDRLCRTIDYELLSTKDTSNGSVWPGRIDC